MTLLEHKVLVLDSADRTLQLIPLSQLDRLFSLPFSSKVFLTN